jgi:hypothetical protein
MPLRFSGFTVRQLGTARCSLALALSIKNAAPLLATYRRSALQSSSRTPTKQELTPSTIEGAGSRFVRYLVVVREASDSNRIPAELGTAIVRAAAHFEGWLPHLMLMVRNGIGGGVVHRRADSMERSLPVGTQSEAPSLRAPDVVPPCQSVPSIAGVKQSEGAPES